MYFNPFIIVDDLIRTLNRVFLDQMQVSPKKLVSTQYLMTSVTLSQELGEETRRTEISKINENCVN